jgi:hypothetical protein
MATTESSASAQTPLSLEERARAIRERSTRGLLLYNSDPDFAHLEGDEWAIRASEGGGFYRVNLAEEVCDCPDFEFYGSEHDVCCKHIVAVAIAHATRRQRREDAPCACVRGWVYIGYEEEGTERQAAYPCRRCNR